MNKLISHFKENKALGSAILFALLVIPVLLFSFVSVPERKQTKGSQPIPTPKATSEETSSNIGAEPTYPPNPYFQEEIDFAWGAVNFSEEDLEGTNARKRQLADGSTLYSFDSENPSRPDMIIVKDSIIIFTRQIVYQANTDNYITGNGKPEYVVRSPSFYNSDSIIYIYPKRGISFTADPKNNVVYEHFIFKPTTIEEFNQSYKQYIN